MHRCGRRRTRRRTPTISAPASFIQTEIIGGQLAGQGHQHVSVARCAATRPKRRWRHQLAKSWPLLICGIEQYARHRCSGSRVDHREWIEAGHTIGISVGRGDHAGVFRRPVSNGGEECRDARVRVDSGKPILTSRAPARAYARYRRGGCLIDGIAEQP